MIDKINISDNHCLDDVTDWLKKVKFRKKIFGGVDERDVWKKIDELNTLYNNALVAERARYDALLKKAKSGDVNNG